MPRELQPCGTPAAYQRHMRKAEVPCDDCAVAWAKHCGRYRRENRVHLNELKRERAKYGPHELAPCGTHAAYARHVRNLERPCYACRVAEAQYQSDRRAKRLEAAR